MHLWEERIQAQRCIWQDLEIHVPQFAISLPKCQMEQCYDLRWKDLHLHNGLRHEVWLWILQVMVNMIVDMVLMKVIVVGEKCTYVFSNFSEKKPHSTLRKQVSAGIFLSMWLVPRMKKGPLWKIFKLISPSWTQLLMWSKILPVSKLLLKHLWKSTQGAIQMFKAFSINLITPGTALFGGFLMIFCNFEFHNFFPRCYHSENLIIPIFELRNDYYPATIDGYFFSVSGA